MTTPRFFYGQTDYITQLNYLDTTFSAAVQAGTDAGTQATAAAASATAASNSATAAAGSATTASGAATTATTQATNASNSASSASSASTAAQGYASTSSSNLTQTLAARDAAITASQVAANPTEMLAAFAQIIHSGNVVAARVGDVAKDSDPNWIKRMLHTGWYNETICTGVWRGQQTNLTAAWNVSGAAVGDYYQNTTDGKFYMIGGTKAAPTQAEVFRGNKREFPALFAVVAEATRVVLYDLTAGGCPMWMVFTQAARNFLSNYVAAGSATSVDMLNSKLVIGVSGNGTCEIDFANDAAVFRSQLGTNCRNWNRSIALRNSNATTDTQASIASLVNPSVAAVALTVLPDAPVDPATGLQIPTIAVGTTSGATVIKSDGTAVNSVDAGSYASIWFDRYGRMWGRMASSSAPIHAFGLVSALASGFGYQTYVYSGTAPALFGSTSTASCDANGRQVIGYGTGNAGWNLNGGVNLLKENPATPGKGMVAYLTGAYNTGWLLGDIRGAWMMDTTVETVSASGELVSNGTFTTDNSGWTPNAAGGTNVVSGGVVTITNPSGGGNQLQTTPITTVVGRTYLVSADCTSVSTFVGAGTAAATPTNLGGAFLTASGKALFQFTATGTTTYIGIGTNVTTASFSATFDNVSCKLAVPDRCVKAKGLTLIGSLTKSAVATGSQLIGFSSYSTSNYQEQPYNSDLDYGTGDFWARGWIKFTTLPVNANVFSRATSGSSAALGVYFNASSNWCFVCSATNVGVATSTVATAGAWTCFDLVRTGGTLTLYINGVSVYSAANTENITNTSALLRVGLNYLLASPLPSDAQLAMLRLGATAPSIDQLAQMYRDELAMFQPGAMVTLDGTTNAIVGAGYEELSDTWHAETGWGRTGFHNLVRTDSMASSVGTGQGVTAGGGVHVTFGSTGARFTQPSLLLRDELRRGYQEKKALAKEIFAWDVDFSAGNTTTTLPLGFTTKNVMAAGTLKRLGSTKDYTVSFDGYRETVTFGTSPGAVWVHVDMNRRL